MNKKIYKSLKKTIISSCITLAFINYAVASNDCSPVALSQNDNIVDAIYHAGQECRTAWYSTPTNLFEHNFGNKQLSTLNSYLKTEIKNYSAQADQMKHIGNIVTYMSAAYYVRYGLKNQYGPYPELLSQDIAVNINEFLNNSYAYSNDKHAESLLGTVILLADSIKELSITLESSLSALSHLNQNNADDNVFIESLNNIFRAMFGHVGNKEFYNTLEQHQEYITRLKDFVLNNSWAQDTNAKIVLSNATRELGRLMISPYQSTKASALEALKQIIEQYPLNEKNAPIWLGAVEMINYYARDQINALGLTYAKERLEKMILPITYKCEGAATVRAQKLTTEQLVDTCQKLNAKETDFHQTMNDGYQPVADDYNDSVDVIVFDSTQDYSTYSAFLFGNPTNNGGIYLEGNPANPKNVARFVAHRNDYAQGFSILNLEHEYTHYLDGRYDLYGDFNHNLKYGNIVWWLEGFAEYMHYKDKNDIAKQIVQNQTQTLSLSDIFKTTYNDGQDRIYRWGYFAVRFMMEKHRDDVDNLLSLSRTNKYKQWSDTVTQLGQNYNSEFALWLQDALSDKTSQQPSHSTHENPSTAPTNEVKELNVGNAIVLNGDLGSQQNFFIDVKPGTRKFAVSISGQGDADMYIKYNSKASYYDFDRQLSPYVVGSSNEVVQFPIDTNGEVQPGRYYISILGRDTFENVSLTATQEIAGTEPSSAKDDHTPVLLKTGDYTQVSINSVRYLVVPLKDSQSNLRVWVTPKTVNGTIGLYVAKDRWPSKNDADAASVSKDGSIYLETNEKTKGGYMYILLTADKAANEIEIYPYSF